MTWGNGGRRRARRPALRRPLIWLGLIVLAFGLQRLAALAPIWTEQVYARGLFPVIAKALSLVFGLFPFSVAELTVWSLGPLLAFLIVAAIRAVWRAPGPKRVAVVAKQATALLISLSLAYSGFIVVWGLNYSREPYAQIVGLKTGPATADELAALCSSLVDRANALRLRVPEDSSGVATLEGGIAETLGRAQLGYDRAAHLYPALAGRYSRPKGVLTSGLLSYTGITGIYWPFTGEANVNVAEPAFDIPASAAHEMAHQRGFAREDEANYIAYVTCRLHPDVDFQYSGTLLALTNAMAALRGVDPARYKELIGRFGPGLRRDLTREDDFWTRYEGPVSDYTDKANDRYLKANGQKEGVQSYGRMVDLLLAEYREGMEGR